MESRISKIEAIIPTLATREDLAKHEGVTRQAIMRLEMTMQAGFERQEKNLLASQLSLQKALNSQTWKVLVWATGLVSLAYGSSFFS